jgi:hypothetical protein
MPKVTKPKAPTVAELNVKIDTLTKECQWANRIITMQQAEIDRLIKLNDSLTTSINNISKWDHS